MGIYWRVWNDNVYPFNYPSHHNRVDHNIFQNKNTPGHFITIYGSFDDSGSEEIFFNLKTTRLTITTLKIMPQGL